MTIKNILVPLNFSDSWENAVNAGIAMCKRHNATLHLLQVKKDHNLIYPPGKNATILSSMLKSEMTILDKLELQSKKITAENGIICFYHTSNGPFNNAVATTVEDFYCDLVVVEKAKNSGIFKMIKVKSVYKLVEYLNCPVLSIPTEKKSFDFKKILLPIRPFEADIEKLEIALPIIKKNRSKVLLFATTHHNKRTEEIESIRSLIEQVELISKDNLYIEKESNNTQDAAMQVINKGIEKTSDLIILTASIKKGLKAFFTPSYTEKVIASSPIPVLCVKIF